jgi:hypothetical protein
MEALRGGFLSIVPKDLLFDLSAQALGEMLNGSVSIDVQDWMNNTVYGDERGEVHPTVMEFWKVVSEMSTEERRKVLCFATGIFLGILVFVFLVTILLVKVLTVCRAVDLRTCKATSLQLRELKAESKAFPLLTPVLTDSSFPTTKSTLTI